MMREDWVEVELGEVGIVTSGGTPSTTNPKFWEGNISWITPADLSKYYDKYISKGRKSITELGLQKSSAKLISKNSILFSSRAPIGYTVIASNELCTNQGFKNITPYSCVNFEFIYYFLKASKQKAELKASGTTFKELSAKGFSELPFPLAPLPIQRAIVAKIEALFSDLDNGIAHFKKAQAQLKIYRQAVLKKAFEGGFTHDFAGKSDDVWTGHALSLQPQTNNQIPDNLPKGWKWVKLGEVGKIITGNTPSKNNEEYYDKCEFPFFKPTDLEQGIYVNSTIDNVSKLGFLAGRSVPVDSILVTCIGATIGKTGLIKREGIFNQQINAIVPNTDFEAKFVYYQVISSSFQEQIKLNASSTTLPILNKSKFSDLDFIKCPLPEQAQIVQEIERRLSVCDKMEQSLNESIEKAEALRQSILKKAFEGTLLRGSEIAQCKKEADYEPASELLKKIKAEKLAKNKKTKNGNP